MKEAKPETADSNRRMSREYTGREQNHSDRPLEVIIKNNGANGFHAALASLQQIPDVEIEFGQEMNQWLRVRRQGITYGINKRSGPSTKGKLGRYVYAVGADLGDGLEFPIQKGNCYGSYVEAVNALRYCILYDPRQTGIPGELRATHVRINVHISGKPE